jgi:hypothetical protein
MGEAKVAEVLDELADRFGLKVQHSIPLTSRRNTRGDLDHVLVVGSPPRFIIAIETKAERPDDRHYDQLLANAQRASRRYFGGVPQYRIIVHPNSSEPVVFDASRMAARMGLPRLRTYLTELLQGTHPDRLVA